MNEWISVKDRLPDIPKKRFCQRLCSDSRQKAGDWVAYYDINGD